jgi:hypothetical protein
MLPRLSFVYICLFPFFLCSCSCYNWHLGCWLYTKINKSWVSVITIIITVNDNIDTSYFNVIHGWNIFMQLKWYLYNSFFLTVCVSRLVCFFCFCCHHDHHHRTKILTILLSQFNHFLEILTDIFLTVYFILTTSYIPSLQHNYFICINISSLCITKAFNCIRSVLWFLVWYVFIVVRRDCRTAWTSFESSLKISDSKAN